jgi:hypothetical protein
MATCRAPTRWPRRSWRVGEDDAAVAASAVSCLCLRPCPVFLTTSFTCCGQAYCMWRGRRAFAELHGRRHFGPWARRRSHRVRHRLGRRSRVGQVVLADAQLEKGKNALKLEGGCNWAVPDKWTDMESGGNFPCDEGGANCNQHLPPPPPLNCEKYCTKSSIAMCSQLGMHCVCESRAHALCGIDCWHAYLTCDRLVSQVGTSNTTRLEKACPTAPAAAVTQAAAANATPRRWCRTTCFTSLAPGRDSESGQRGGCDVSPMQHGAVGQNVSSIEPPAMAKSSRRATPRTGLYY